MKRLLGLFVVGLFALSLAYAQGNWTVDKNHSQILFTVSHMVFSEVTGTFRDFDVIFESTKDDFTDAKIVATIKANSIDTQNERRDNHLKSDDFLNAEKYPEIAFKSTTVEKLSEDTYRITGQLTIRNVTKPVVLDVKFRGMIDDPWGNKKIAFKATTTIDRFDFGVAWNKTLEAGGLIAGREVQVTLLMQFARPKAQG